MDKKRIRETIAEVYKDSGIGEWMGENEKGTEPGWDRYNTKGDRVGKCGDSKPGEGKPKCLSKEKADKLRKQGGKKAIANAVRRKREQDPVQDRPGTGNKPKNVSNNIKEATMEKIQITSLFESMVASINGEVCLVESVNRVGDTSICVQYIKENKERGKEFFFKNEFIDILDESESFQLDEEKDKKKVKLGKPFRTPGGPKKFGVYVKNAKGNVVLVRFGDPNMEIKRDDPKRRKNFRSRHGCDNPGPKWKARYWACRTWEKGKTVSEIVEKKEEDHEFSMARSELDIMQDAIERLRKKLGRDPKEGEIEAWIQSKITKAADYLDTAADYMDSDEGLTEAAKNKPNDPELWSRAKSEAKERFDVYPSAYANAWASKWYKEKGGTWSKLDEQVVKDADGKQFFRTKEGKKVVSSIENQIGAQQIFSGKDEPFKKRLAKLIAIGNELNMKEKEPETPEQGEGY